MDLPENNYFSKCTESSLEREICMLPEYHVSIIILDEDFLALPEEIIKQTGIQPSTTWHKGEVKHNTSMFYKDNGWELKSILPLSSPLADHVNSLLNTVNFAHQKFISFTSKYFSILSCAIYFDEQSPQIYFENELLKHLADLNLRLDIDIYCLSET